MNVEVPSLRRQGVAVWSLALVAAVCLAPAARMGWLRDDWLLLWASLDPSGAPAGAAGVFPRPLSEAQWRGVAAIFGDAPVGMHAVAVLGWILLMFLAWRQLRVRDASLAPIALALGWWVSHGSLVEPRLWAAASNGVWAVALAWVAVSLHRRGGAWRWWSGLAWIAASLLRADALALLVLVLPSPRRLAPGRRALLIAGFATVGGIALAVMVGAGGEWSLNFADSGRALRRLVVPYGPALPAPLEWGLGLGVWCALLATVGAWLSGVDRAVVVTGLLATLAAHSLVSWSAAGRYLMVPAALAAVELARLLAAPGSGSRWGRRVLTGWILAAVVAATMGHSARELQLRSGLETELYRRVREVASTSAWQQAEAVAIVDAPPLGWRGTPADLENIVSAALRRRVRVVERPTTEGPSLRYQDGHWRPGGAAPEFP